jgi:N-acetylmuramoyl-L-alanine amidase
LQSGLSGYRLWDADLIDFYGYSFQETLTLPKGIISLGFEVLYCLLERWMTLNKKWLKLLSTGVAIIIMFINTASVLAGAVYTVKAGDSLYEIARWYQLSVDDLRQANQIWNDLIIIGQDLTIPDKKASSGPRIPYTQEELDLLARLVEAETSGEPYLGKVAAAAVTINRVLDSRYPDTLKEVIYQVVDGSYQYEPVLNGRIDLPAGADSLSAALEALSGVDPTYGALGFYNPDKVSEYNWVRKWPVITKIGKHVFFTHE